MKWLPTALALVLMIAVGPASAERPTDLRSWPSVGISPGQVSATPDMWFYEQELRRYLDPKAMVRQKAEFRAQQRQARLAAQKWFGFLGTRPMASSDPYHGDYSPTWTSSNGRYPFRWSGGGSALVVQPYRLPPTD